MNSKIWSILIAKLPPGLSQVEAAKYLGMPLSTVRYWMLKYGYASRNGRAYKLTKRRMKVVRLDDSKVNWSLMNADIARQFGVSRQRVFQKRLALFGERWRNHNPKPK